MVLHVNACLELLSLAFKNNCIKTFGLVDPYYFVIAEVYLLCASAGSLDIDVIRDRHRCRSLRRNREMHC